MAADDVVINIRSRGGRQAATDIRRVETSLRGINRAAGVASTGVRNLRSNLDFSPVRRGMQYTGYAVAGLGALALKTGIQFNATMEQNQVAFKTLLGSTAAARKELGFLYKTAAVTPFQVGDITLASRQLLTYNFTLRETNAWLLTVADSMAAAGKGPEEIERLIRAVGQIKGRGKLVQNELNQIGELGILDRRALAKNLGVTMEELGDVGKLGITSTRALRALKKTLDDSFGGASAEQAKTFNGQMSTLRDNLNMTLGIITKPGFDWLRGKGLPALGRTTTQIKKIFDHQDWDLSKKITASQGTIRRNLGPLWNEIERGIGELNLGKRITDGVDAAAPVLLTAGTSLGVKAAKAFVDAWMHAGFWTKFASGAWLAHKFGLTSAAAKGLVALLAGKKAGGALGGIGGALGGLGASPKRPMWVVVTNPNGPYGVPGPGGKPGKKKPRLPGGIPAISPLLAGPAAFGAAYFGNADDAGLPPDQERAMLDAGRASASRYYSRLAKAGKLTGAARRHVIENHIPVYVDGKQIAVVKNRIDADDKRRGRRKPRGTG